MVVVASTGVSIHTGHLYDVRADRPILSVGLLWALIASSRCLARTLEKVGASSTSVRSRDSMFSSFSLGIDDDGRAEGFPSLRRLLLIPRGSWPWRDEEGPAM
jgi:hypothetical protein